MRTLAQLGLTVQCHCGATLKVDGPYLDVMAAYRVWAQDHRHA